MKDNETFADWLRLTRHGKKLSLVDVVEKSGGRVSNAYVSKLENGQIQSPHPGKLRSLAKGLGVPEDEVLARAYGDKLSVGDLADTQAISFLSDFEKLSAKDKEFFRQVIKMFHSEVLHRLEEKGSVSSSVGNPPSVKNEPLMRKIVEKWKEKYSKEQLMALLGGNPHTIPEPDASTILSEAGRKTPFSTTKKSLKQGNG